MWNLRQGKPIPIQELRSDLPANISCLIGAMLSREPYLRPANAAEVLAALSPGSPIPPQQPPPVLVAMETSTTGSAFAQIISEHNRQAFHPQPAPANPFAAAAQAATQPAANPAPAQPAQPEKKTGSILGKTNGKIVDLAEVKKNPKIVEFDSKVTGSDPLTVSFNAYVSITSRASVLTFKHNMDILKETNGGQYPSFKEAQKLMKDCNLQLASLPPWQLYAYDAKTGGVIVMEDKTEKIRLYKFNNIPLEEADKQYDATAAHGRHDGGPDFAQQARLFRTQGAFQHQAVGDVIAAEYRAFQFQDRHECLHFHK